MKRFLSLAAIFLVSLAVAHAADRQVVPFSDQQVCAAGLGAMMGRDPRIVKTTKTDGKIFYMHYIRSNDGSRWAYRCTIEGTRIMWAAEEGRWRNHPLDEILTYSIAAGRLTIFETINSETRPLKAYTAAQLPRVHSR